MCMGAAVDPKFPERLILRDQNTCRQIAEWAFALHERPVEPHVEDRTVDVANPHDCLPEPCAVSAEVPTASDICQRR